MLLRKSEEYQAITALSSGHLGYRRFISAINANGSSHLRYRQFISDFMNSLTFPAIKSFYDV